MSGCQQINTLAAERSLQQAAPADQRAQLAARLLPVLS